MAINEGQFEQITAQSIWSLAYDEICRHDLQEDVWGGVEQIEIEAIQNLGFHNNDVFDGEATEELHVVFEFLDFGLLHFPGDPKGRRSKKFISWMRNIFVAEKSVYNCDVLM